MPRKNKYSPRKIYRLWWEYLKRSRIYAEYLKWQKNYYSRNDGEGESRKKKVGKKFLSSKYQGLKAGSEFFGDVFTNRFEDFWKSRKDYSVFEQPTDELFSIFPLHESLEGDLDKIAGGFNKRNGRDPNIEEFKKEIFKYYIFGGDDGTKIYFGISLSPFQGIQTICKQFQWALEKFVKGFRENQGKGQYPPVPTEPVRLNSIEQYLFVYDLRKSWMRWREIAKKVYPQEEFSNSLRAILRNEEKKQKELSRMSRREIFLENIEPVLG